jgi:hypothetical protein
MNVVPGRVCVCVRACVRLPSTRVCVLLCLCTCGCAFGRRGVGVWPPTLVHLPPWGPGGCLRGWLRRAGQLLAGAPFLVQLAAAAVYGVCQVLPLLHIMHDASHTAIGHSETWWKVVGRVTMEWCVGQQCVATRLLLLFPPLPTHSHVAGRVPAWPAATCCVTLYCGACARLVHACVCGGVHVGMRARAGVRTCVSERALRTGSVSMDDVSGVCVGEGGGGRRRHLCITGRAPPLERGAPRDMRPPHPHPRMFVLWEPSCLALTWFVSCLRPPFQVCGRQHDVLAAPAHRGSPPVHQPAWRGPRHACC